jgi:F-type H+-transporting ATPase subunit b
VDVLATGAVATALLAQAEGGAGLQINLFWIIVSALNFAVLLVLLWQFALRPISRMLDQRQARIEQGLRDAEQARRDREAADAERAASLAEARREANDILNRAQKIAQETREADLKATREELERLRVAAADDIESEKQRAMADLRSQVAALALEAAGKVVGESMNDARQHRLVEDFLRESATDGKTGSKA